MSNIRTEQLATIIHKQLAHTSRGHCARVDYLTREESLALCVYMQHHTTDYPFLARLLDSANNVETLDETVGALTFTTDQAIEQRNLKEHTLCLFVPTDMVDAAVSSLGNSFAPIDGRTLLKNATEQVDRRLSMSASIIVKNVFAKLLGKLKVGEEQRLDFICAVYEREQRRQLAEAGRELWRVGLIADAGEDFVSRLKANCDSVRTLKHPEKLYASTSERIQKLGVDSTTAHNLMLFFRGRELYDIASWSRAMAENTDPNGKPFDQWTFPDAIPSDIQSVTIDPFIDKKGAVRKITKLVQPEGPGTNLIAYCDEQGALAVKWKTEPVNPQNLSRWRVSIVASSSDDSADDDNNIELLSREIAGHRGSLTLKLDELADQLDDLPINIARVQVTALDSSGSEMMTSDTDEKISDTSEEFVLALQGADQQQFATHQQDSRRTVPSIAFGRLELIVEKDVRAIEETEPHIISKDGDYFSLKLSDRNGVAMSSSKTLRELQHRALTEPSDGGRYLLTTHEIRPVEAQTFVPLPMAQTNTAEWQEFWRERQRLFNHILQAESPRNLIETAEWTDDLAKSINKYVKSYQKLIESLIANSSTNAHDVLLDALSIDTTLVQLTLDGHTIEEAHIILPTHPLRLAWFATYTSTLRQWETELLERKKQTRKHALDMSTIEMLAPINIPAFTYHPVATTPGVFFQNLHMLYGVAFPARIPDPQRLFSDIATLLTAQTGDIPTIRVQPERLAYHITRFTELHPYTNTVMIDLVNPDRGDLVANALTSVIDASTHDGAGDDDDDTPAAMPNIHITSYVNDARKSHGVALDALRRLNNARSVAATSDYLLPLLTATVRHMDDANEDIASLLHESHIAIGTDLTRPRIEAATSPATMNSMSFQGLLCRFISSFSQQSGNIAWRYHIITDSTAKDDILSSLHHLLLQAGGKWLQLEATSPHTPALEVAINAPHQQLLERMHQQATWVVTLDRFFVLDYYDSPFEPLLEDSSRKYVLDYAPELVEGLGHRLMVTTTWQDEIGTILERAMEEQGFTIVDNSVNNLLHYLKIISGRLILQAYESNSMATAAVGLGVVAAWFNGTGKLANAILVPIDPHPRMFMQHTKGKPAKGERRCDLMLVTLKRNIVEATFIEVKWRRGRAPIEELANDMTIQMEQTAHMIAKRFFNDERLDGALQRSYFATVLHFYLERAVRYHLIAPDIAQKFTEHLVRLEKSKIDFRPSYEGYIVNLDSPPRSPFVIGNARITLLTADDFAKSTEFYTKFTITPDTVAPPMAPHQQDTSTHDAFTPLTIPDAPNNTPTATATVDNITVPLGTSAGVEINWQPSVKGSPHLFILGIPGQGKSWATTRILTVLGQQQVPALVLDFHGQFAEADSPFMQYVSPVVIDAAKGLPFSPFECNSDEGQEGWKANSFAISEIFAYVTGLGDMQRDVLFQAIRDAYIARGYGDGTHASGALPTLNEVLENIEAREQKTRTANVVARCRPLLEMELFRPDGQAALGTLVEQGVVIDLHNLYAETLQLAAGAFVLRKIYKDMFHWGTTNRLRLAIVLDEAHRLARDITLPKIMKEGRKFGIAVVVASQGLGDFHQDIVSNAGTKVIFRVNYPDSRKIAGFIRARQGQDVVARLEQLAVGHAYVQTPDMRFGSVVQMHPLMQNMDK